MRRYWQYKQRWRQISGFRRWLLPGILIGGLLFRGVAMAEESRRPGLQLSVCPGLCDHGADHHGLSAYPSAQRENHIGVRVPAHPVTGERDFHTGIDIAAAEGTPVVAALPGTVTKVGYDGIYGNYVRMSHGTN